MKQYAFYVQASPIVIEICSVWNAIRVRLLEQLGGSKEAAGGQLSESDRLGSEYGDLFVSGRSGGVITAPSSFFAPSGTESRRGFSGGGKCRAAESAAPLCDMHKNRGKIL